MTKQTNPEVSAKPTRRTFSAADKRRILAAADALKAAGENLGPMLRREGLYRSQLSDWRRALAARGDEGLTPSKRGPKGKASPKETLLELRKRDRRIAALERKLAHAEVLIDPPKKNCGAGSALSVVQRRGLVMNALAANVGGPPLFALCAALEVARSTIYRHRRAARACSVRAKPPRALSEEERGAILEHLHSDRFVDRAPAEVVHTLLADGIYLGSERTMYRILADNDEVRERRRQRTHPVYAKPELMATAPNQVWSWDITRLRTTRKWEYLSLYVVMDIFSRAVVGWMVAEKETAALACRLIDETVEKPTEAHR